MLKFQALFGVFDGHGGSEAAEFCSKNMGQFITDELAKREGESSEAIEAAVRNGYLRTDKEFLKGDSKGGACCLTALLHKGNLVISNAGDCRAVLCRGGQAEALTSDHKLSRQDERERVEQLVSPLLVTFYMFVYRCSIIYLFLFFSIFYSIGLNFFVTGWICAFTERYLAFARLTGCVKRNWG